MTQQTFQIKEDDLATLEHTLPQLQEALMPILSDKLCAPRLQTQLERVKRILSNVRWDYGPPSSVEFVSGD